jgi:hypothetical protein
MTAQETAPIVPFPVTCSRCGGIARLLTVVPDSFTRQRFEIWRYECTACAGQIEHIKAKET